MPLTGTDGGRARDTGIGHAFGACEHHATPIPATQSIDANAPCHPATNHCILRRIGRIRPRRLTLPRWCRGNGCPGSSTTNRNEPWGAASGDGWRMWRPWPQHHHRSAARHQPRERPITYPPLSGAFGPADAPPRRQSAVFPSATRKPASMSHTSSASALPHRGHPRHTPEASQRRRGGATAALRPCSTRNPRRMLRPVQNRESLPSLGSPSAIPSSSAYLGLPTASTVTTIGPAGVWKANARV